MGCGSGQVKADYAESYEEYKYRYSDMPYKVKLILFKVFSFNLRCGNCGCLQTIEVEVPLLRRMYRWFFKKDIDSEWLKNI